MTTVSFEWKIEEIDNLLSRRGERMAKVTETYLGIEHDPQVFGPMPGRVAESFVRARRDKVAKLMQQEGGIRLITN